MAHYSTLHDFKFADQANDLRGAELYGFKDEKLGKIDDVIFDHQSGVIKYGVVDTGGWLRHRKFIVPAELIHPYAKHEDHFAADLSKEQIETFPPYDEKSLESPEQWGDYEKQYRDEWARYEKEYKKNWQEGGVAHRTGSDHVITPTADEMPVSSGGGSTAATGTPGYTPNLTPERLVSPTAPPRGPSTMLRPAEDTPTSHAVNPWTKRSLDSVQSTRWQNFQSSIQRDLPQITRVCSVCVPSHRMASENAASREPEERRKAS